MDAAERDAIASSLKLGRKKFLNALNGISEASATKRPRADSWSALECVEHVAVSEEFLLSLVRNAERVNAVVINKPREARILAFGADRSRPAVSPSTLLPTGRFSSLASAVLHFQVNRAKTIQFVEDYCEDLRATRAMHPLLGHISGHEVLLLIMVHSDRHAKQIMEIKGQSSCLPGDS